MKSLTSKKWLVIGVAVILLSCVGGLIMVRRQSSLKPREIEAKRYPHEHLHSSEWEQKSKLNADDYTLRQDETLAQVATLRYGHQNYYRLIKLFNHIDDESQVAAESKLRIPDVSVILAHEGLTKMTPDEVELILCSRAKYDRVVEQLWRIRADSYVVPDGVKRELFEAADDLQQAIERLNSTRPGVINSPRSMIGQLEECMTMMRELTRGSDHVDPNGYDIDLVQQRYALAITYWIIWARDGFK